MSKRWASLALGLFSIVILAAGCTGGEQAQPIAAEEVVSAQSASLRIEGMT